MGRCALLDLVLTNKEELFGNVRVMDSLSCSDQDMVHFRTLKGQNTAKSKTITMGLHG